MSFPSGAIWNWRSGFGICFRQTTMFKATAGGRRDGRYLTVSPDARRDGRPAMAIGPPGRPSAAVSRAALVPSAQGLPQDVDLLAPRARDPPATRGDAGTHRVLAPSQIASPSILDPFRLGRASLRRGVWPRRAVRAAGPATPVRSPTGKCRATCTLRRRG